LIFDSIQVPIRYTDADLKKAICKAAKNPKLKIQSISIIRKSIDARKKPMLFYNLKVLVNEAPKKPIDFPKNIAKSKEPVVVVGAGPAGLFASYRLALSGVKVILLERGKKVEERTEDVEKFFQTGVLDPNSNVQFGEGGAGTFSDGKLNTRVKDASGLHEKVLSLFVEWGADPVIMADPHAHVGTDRLVFVIQNLRHSLEDLGVDLRYSACLTDFQIENGVLQAVCVNQKEWIKTNHVVLAIGHSARDTYELLRNKNVFMEKKAFAVGVRMEHLQRDITMSQYGSLDYEELGAAPYQVTASTSSGRGVYSFCMCPGGYVVNASSEEGHLCVNGMSYAARDSKNANAGIVVQVNPEDYPSDDVLSGLQFQRDLEKKAYDVCNGKIPVQRYGDFIKEETTTAFGKIVPQMKGAYDFGKMQDVLPRFLCDALREAIPKFGRMIHGFDTEDAILSAVEARTSSPVRIVRDKNLEANVKGIYPAGEGAGYAGGIVSAAMDGLRIAGQIIDELKEQK